MILINRQVNNHYSMGGTHFLQTGYLLLNRNAPRIIFYFYILRRHFRQVTLRFSYKTEKYAFTFMSLL